MIQFFLISILISFLIILISVWVEDNRLNKLRHDIDMLSEKIRAIERRIGKTMI